MQAGRSQRLPNQLVLDLIKRIDHFGFCVANTQFAVEAVLGSDINTFVDGCAEHTTSMVHVVAGKIGAPTKEADAQRRLNDDHCGTSSPMPAG